MSTRTPAAQPIMESDEEKSYTEKSDSVADVSVHDTNRARLPSTDGVCDPAVERSIKRKCDLHIIPWAFVLWMLAFFDRSNLSNAKVLGLTHVIDLSGDRFNTALVVFHSLFILVNLPSNLIFKRIGGRIYLPALALAWGVVTACIGSVKTYGGLIACRILLGGLQGGFFSGMILYLGMFYKRHELMLRFGIFISGTSLSGAFGGLLAFGLGHIEYGGYKGWPWIFFVEGAITVTFAIITFFFLPNTPCTARFLTENERTVAVHRLYLDVQVATTVEEVDKEKIKWSAVRSAILNVNTLLNAISSFLIMIPIYSFGIFLPVLIIGIGMKKHDPFFTAPGTVNGLTVPPNFVAFLSTLAISYLSHRLRMRGPLIPPLLAIAAAGYIMQLASSNFAVQYAGTFLIGAGALPGTALMFPWLSNNLAPHYSRATGLGFSASITQCGAVVATFTYLKSDGPNYNIGHSINLGALALAAIGVTVNVLYIRWENAARKAGKRDYRLQQVREGRELGYRHPAFMYTM